MRINSSGFTIVELLIVIVVIAILATISAVAYNGIQIRGENVKTEQAVSGYAKALLSYKELNSIYPITTTYPCLGTLSTCGRITGSTLCLGNGSATTNSPFMTDMKTVVVNLPEPSMQTMDCGGMSFRGAFYGKNDNTAGKTASIVYFLKGDQPCTLLSGVSSVSRSQQDETTVCTARLPTIP